MFFKFCEEHPFACAALLVLLLVLLFRPSENFVNRTINFIAWRNPDPTLYKYTNRNRDRHGMDMNDRFLENQMTFKEGLGPELTGEAAFSSRVIAEGTVLKDTTTTFGEALQHQDFVGGMAY